MGRKKAKILKAPSPLLRGEGWGEGGAASVEFIAIAGNCNAE
jgi:hypothetical protein